MSIFKYIVSFIALTTLSYASIGKITVTNGDISVLRASKSLKASSGFALEEKDSIKSTKGSTAQLVFNDNTVITVGSNTTFSVQEYSSDASSPKAKFAIAEGTFKTITGKIGKIAPDKFKMETKTATIGIRGTTVVGNVAPDGTLTVACTRGAITVTPNVPQGQPTVVPQGQFTKSKGGNVEPPRQLTPNDLRNLQGDLAPLARNNTPATEAQEGGNGGGQPTQSTQNNPIPNLDNIKELTSKVAENLVNDGVLQKSVKPWADTYTAGGYISGTSYQVNGWKTSFSSLNGVVSGDSSLESNVGLTLNVATKTVTAVEGILDSPTYSALTISSEDSFSFGVNGTIYDAITYDYVPATAAVTTASDSAGADYVSWGYWATSYTDGNSGDAKEFGTWVGGAKTAVSSVPISGTATYKGNVIGGVVGGVGPAPVYSPILMNSFNSATFNVDFGSNKSVAGNLSFNTASGQTWNVNFSGPSSIDGNGFWINADTFGHSISGQAGNGGTVDNIPSNSVGGDFYGPNANAVAGGFSIKSSDNYGASGVFKANKQ
jgi:hypothetical protein